MMNPSSSPTSWFVNPYYSKPYVSVYFKKQNIHILPLMAGIVRRHLQIALFGCFLDSAADGLLLDLGQCKCRGYWLYCFPFLLLRYSPLGMVDPMSEDCVLVGQ